MTLLALGVGVLLGCSVMNVLWMLAGLRARVEQLEKGAQVFGKFDAGLDALTAKAHALDRDVDTLAQRAGITRYDK